MREKTKLSNVNISSFERLPTPKQIKKALPASKKILSHVLDARQVIRDILDGKDERIFLVVGPCSIHDPIAAREYAAKLAELSKKVRDKIFIVMRVYFEKPRTTVGWKGLINDPFLDDSFRLEKGLRIARELLIDFNKMGLPAGTEALDPVTPQYLSELVSWAAIGARTTESQTHREMASGLSMPVGFKNATDGNLQVAIDAMKSAERPHHFLGINQDGKICRFATTGNSYTHIVLRGGGGKANYDAESIRACESFLEKNKLRKKIIVDCSHANSNKDYSLQPAVFENCIQQIVNGNKSIVGLMLESNLNEGNQSIPKDLKQLKYGVSVTDACIDWKTTEELILGAYGKLES